MAKTMTIRVNNVLFKKDREDYKLRIGDETHYLERAQSYRLYDWLSLWISDKPLLNLLVSQVQ